MSSSNETSAETITPSGTLRKISTAADYSEFRRGWPLVVAATIGIGLGLSPVPFYEIGILAPELVKAFQWTFADIMGGVFFLMVGVVVMAPLIGRLADRFGVRVVTLTSIVGFSLSLSLFAFQTGSLPVYYATWFLMAVAGAGTLPITWTRTVNQSFEIHKGLALGVVLAGSGISSFLLKPAVAWIMVDYGWQGGFLLLAALPVLIAFPLAWFFFHPAPVDVAIKKVVAAPVDGMTLRQALCDWRFWAIIIGILPIVFAVAGVIANLEIVLKDRQISTALILSVTPFLGLSVIAGRLVGGWLIDRFWAPAASLGMLLLAALAVWALGSGPTSYIGLLLVVFGVGLAAGVEFDLLAFFTARYFGLAHYSGIYGVMYIFFAVGSGAAPYTFGLAYDATQSFTAILNISAICIAFGGLIFLTLGKYRYGVKNS